MGFLKSLSRWRTKAADSAVAFASGEQPVKALDTPHAYRLIVVVGVLAILGSGWFVYRSIVEVGTPIAFRKTSNGNANVNATTAIAELEKLKGKDTDGDQVDDYTELFNYQTSPYLKDSDSDGQDDRAEVTKGTDPNCPAGKSCASSPVLTTPTDSTGELTPEFLRQALKQSGVAQATLDELSDSDLLQLYQSILADNSAIQNENVNAPTSLSDLNNLTAAEIRQLLIESGVDATTLQNVDDATLRQIFLQGLNTNS
jgi:hypothetical protein